MDAGSFSKAGLSFEEALEGDCPAWPSGGGTAAPEVPPEKHKQLQQTHRVPEQGLGTGKVLLFYPNPALCMFSVLVFTFSGRSLLCLPHCRLSLGMSVLQQSDTRDVRGTSNTKPSFQTKKQNITLNRKYSGKGHNNCFPLTHSELTPGLCCQPSNCLWQCTHVCTHVPHILKKLLANSPQIQFP